MLFFESTILMRKNKKNKTLELPYMYLTTTGHVNYGPPGLDKKVDEWHFDSVAFVAVIILRFVKKSSSSIK